MIHTHLFKDIISIENLCKAWNEFVCGKRTKRDIAEFSLNLSRNIFLLHEDLKNLTYTHGGYKHFKISDPKPRDIHKASVRDRLLHHAIYRVLYPHFDKKFIHDSYSCRLGKGTHRAIRRFKTFVRKVSKNNTKSCWVLKCDIKKFFASIDQTILFQILEKHIDGRETLGLLQNIIQSFETKLSKGLPLGNLTSQLLVNIYMNEFDQFVKHKLKQNHYIRYADDFVFLHYDKDTLLELLPKIGDFLEENLKLTLHPNKIFLQTIHSGLDFLGWVNFYHHRTLRTTTKKRMFRNIKAKQGKPETIASYKGLLGHGDGYKILREIENMTSKQGLH